MQRDQIIRRLKNDVEDALRAYLQASADFDALVGESLFGLPHPDGQFRVRKAGEQFKKTLRAYTRSIRRLDEFVRTGKLPRDGD